MRFTTWSTLDLARTAAIAACCIGGLVVSINCKPGGPPPPPPTTATSSVSFWMSASGAPKCTANLRWEWTPIAVGGGSGRTTPITLPASGFTLYDVFAKSSGDRESHCTFDADPLVAFAPGAWRLTLVSPVAGTLAQCQVTLRIGANWAGFRQNVGTCKETPAGSLGFEYP